MTAMKAARQKPRTVCQFCMRCDRPFRAETSSRECFLCHQASERLYGTDHPAMELSGM